MRAPTFRERQRQIREDAILDAAQDLLYEQGYADMSMDDLAARVGVSKATLYQHFASKEDLAINVIVRSMRRGEERINALDTSRPAIDRLEQMIRTGIQGKMMMGGGRALLPPQIIMNHPLYQEQRARMMAALSSLVEEAKAAGDLKAHLPTPLLVQMLSGVIRIVHQDDLLDQQGMDIDAYIDLVIEMVFSGVRADSSQHTVRAG